MGKGYKRRMERGLVQHLYVRKRDVSGPQHCVYCGARAQCQDHTPPLAWAAGQAKPDELELWLVPACLECNALLGASVHETFAERVEFAKTRLRARYAKVMTLPEWTAEELDELGGRTATEVARAAEAKRTVGARLAWECLLVDDG